MRAASAGCGITPCHFMIKSLTQGVEVRRTTAHLIVSRSHRIADQAFRLDSVYVTSAAVSTLLVAVSPLAVCQ